MSEENENTTSEQTPQSIPPIPFSRNEYGLLTHINYVFDDEGFIDWRKMIDPKFLFPNKEVTDKTNVAELKDNELIIQLGGIKKLARVRGFESVKHRTIVATSEYVAVETTIEWLPNYETSGTAVTFTALADASSFNTTGFTKSYLASMAENRGFVRAVRNFLNINIVGKEELGANIDKVANASESNGKSRGILDKLLEVNSVSFESFQNRMIKENIDGAADWTSLDDVPEAQIFEVIGKVETALEERKAKKK